MNVNKTFLGFLMIPLSVIMILTSTVYGQSAWDKKPTNLKVLPETTSPQQLRQIMQTFTSALNVHCSYCHEEPKSGDFNSVDFASDAKDTKKVARVMMKMVNTINDKFIAEASQIDKLNGPVGCVTCHHGMAHIQSLSEALFKTYNNGGLDSTFTKYNELKKRYYGGFTYNFKEESLNELAGKLIAAKNYDDAITILNFNSNMYPESAEIFSELGDAYFSKGDKATAKLNYEKALSINPRDRRVIGKLKNIE